MVNKESLQSKLLNAVFDNVPELVAYYPKITSLVPYTDDTGLWVIGRPGSTKTSIALALAHKLKNDTEIKGKKPRIWLVDFDRHLTYMEDATGWSRRKPSHAGLLLPLTAYSLLNSLYWIEENSDKPSISVIDLSVIPHRRDNGRNVLHQALYDARYKTGKINRIIPVRPGSELIAQILAGRQQRDEKRQYSRNTASAEVTVKAYLDEFDLIDEFITKGILPERLLGFREDPEKADEALKGIHILECQKALGVSKLKHRRNREEFYQTVKVEPLPTDIAAQLTDDLLQEWVHEYPLPLDVIIKDIIGPNNKKAFIKAIRKVSPEQRIHFPIPEPLLRTETKYPPSKKTIEKMDYRDPDLAPIILEVASRITRCALPHFNEKKIKLNLRRISKGYDPESFTEALEALQEERLILLSPKGKKITVLDITQLQEYIS